MDSTKTDFQYEAKEEILHNLPQSRIGRKTVALFVGLGLTAVLLLSVLVILCAHLSIRKQVFPIGDQTHTTPIVQNVSTSTGEYLFVLVF